MTEICQDIPGQTYWDKDFQQGTVKEQNLFPFNNDDWKKILIENPHMVVDKIYQQSNNWMVHVTKQSQARQEKGQTLKLATVSPSSLARELDEGFVIRSCGKCREGTTLILEA